MEAKMTTKNNNNSDLDNKEIALIAENDRLSSILDRFNSHAGLDREAIESFKDHLDERELRTWTRQKDQLDHQLAGTKPITASYKQNTAGLGRIDNSNNNAVIPLGKKLIKI